MRSTSLLFGLVIVAACDSGRESVPSARLHEDSAAVSVELNEIARGVWLGGSRFGLVSPSDDRVAIVDMDAGTARLITTDSTILHPSQIFARGDTLFVSDWGRNRITAWAGTDLQRAFPAPPAARGALPRATDGEGRLYFEIAPDPGRNGRGNRDSATVIRVTPASGLVDTVATLTPLDVAEVATDQGPRWERRVFSGNDEWGALPDGSLWVARTYHNRVDWRDTSGKWTKGEPLPDRILQVTDADRRRFVERFPPELKATAERLPYAPLKAPFVSAFAGADGTVWLEKSRHIADTVQTYQLIDREGRYVQEFVVAGWGRVVAASVRDALIARTDTVGYLLRLAPLDAAAAQRPDSGATR